MRSIGVKLMADVSGYQAGMRAATASTRGFNSELDRAARGGHLDAVADQAGRMGVAAAGGFGLMVKASMDFDKAMSAVSAATHASVADMGRLREAALQAGKDTQFSATAAAKGVEELAKAGVSTGAILSGGLKGALSLAAAGTMDVGDAAEAAASAMTQFKLKGSDVPHVADLLAAGAGKAQGSVHDMSQALNQSGLVAAQMGLSVEETTGTLTAFASAGLLGSDAGTSLKTALLMLANPTDKAATLMKELGIHAYDAGGKFVGMAGLAGQLKTKLGGLTQEQRNSALATIFGSDAIRAASVLYEQGAQGIQNWTNKVNDQGYAAETAAKKTDNLAGDLERLKGSLEVMAIESSSGANGGLRFLTQSVEALVDEFSALPAPISGTITVLAGLGGAALLAGAGWVKMRRSTADALAELRNTGPVGAKAATGLSALTKGLGRATIAFVAYEVAMAAAHQIQGEMNPKIDALGVGLTKWARGGELAGESARILGKDLGLLTHGFENLADGSVTSNLAEWSQKTLELVPFVDGAEHSLKNLADRAIAVDQTLAGMVAGGNTADAAAIFDALAKQLVKGNVSMKEFKGMFPEYAAAVEVAGAASKDGAGAVSEVGTAAEQAAGKVQQLKDAFDALFDKEMSLDQATLKYREGLSKLTEELDKGKTTTSLNSAEGLKNRKAVLDQIETIRDLRAARIEHGETLDQANAKYVTDIDGLRKSMDQAGFTKAEINELTGAYRAIPETAHTKVTVEGVAAAKAELTSLSVYQQALKKGDIGVGFQGPIKGPDGKYYADGGWTGPGGKYEPAGIVHADEFVIQKSARQKLERQHPGLLDHANRYGDVDRYVGGYAGGGLVVWPFPVTVAGMKIPSREEVAAKVMPNFGDWPSSPAAQRGDSGIWRRIIEASKAAGFAVNPSSTYRDGDPKWHGSGRAVDFGGFDQDGLASWWAGRHPLELIHRSSRRDYAYTRGVDQGSFNESLMNAHRNHVHVAMAGGGHIGEHIFGVGRSGRTYEFGEAGPETVTPGVHGYAGGGLVNVTPRERPTPTPPPERASRLDFAESYVRARDAVKSLSMALKENGRTFHTATVKGRENTTALYSGIRAAQQAAKTKFEETGSVAKANAVYSAHIAALRRTLVQQKVNATTIRNLMALATRPKYDVPTPERPAPKPLTNSLSTIAFARERMTADRAVDNARNFYTWGKPSFALGTDQGRDNLNQLFTFLEAAGGAAQAAYTRTGNAKTATALYNGYLTALRKILGKTGMSVKEIAALLRTYGRITLGNRMGGLYEHAQTGTLRDAHLAPAGPTRYAYAEPATGGELFAPKHGNLAKTRAQVGWAVTNWWGGQATWGGGKEQGGAMTIRVVVDDGAVKGLVHVQVDQAFGALADAQIYATAG